MVSLEHERRWWSRGAGVVAGIDEVGRGALAGPVSVGVVAVADIDAWPEGLADSKRLSAQQRERMYDALASFGVARAVGSATPAEIDDAGIVAALRLAGLRPLERIAAAGVKVDAVLLDGKHDWLSGDQGNLFVGAAAEVPPVEMVIGGDDVCASIAAASVVAKVERDAEMVRLDGDHPEYGWAGNKGYGAATHREAIRTHGATAHHRRSWNLLGDG